MRLTCSFPRLGDTVMLSIIGPGETFGEIALLDDTAPRSATVVAVEKAETRARAAARGRARERRRRGAADAGGALQPAGTSRTTVNRVLREAQARGEVALRRGRIEVLDAERLCRR